MSLSSFLLSFIYASGDDYKHTYPDTHYGVIVPHAAFMLLFGSFGMVWLRRVIRDTVHRRRSARGLCVSCSYDLTGNTSGTCPECGKAVAEKATA
ncbi:MAG TPA: hypothetical protein VIM11_13255 [Tepidisphaeraceae bacterium]|jgi:hypothetical protein